MDVCGGLAATPRITGTQLTFIQATNFVEGDIGVDTEIDFSRLIPTIDGLMKKGGVFCNVDVSRNPSLVEIELDT